MTLQEAIKAIENRPIGVDPDSSHHLNTALLLLIEAGKRILKERQMGAGADWGHLDGETKE